MRPLVPLLITPSVDLSELAEQHQRDMPYLIQYFVNGLGRDAASCSDLMSYLLFTPKYTKELIDIGYNDASKRIDEIEDFLYSSDNEDTELPSRPIGAGKSRQVVTFAKPGPNLVKSRG